MHLSPLILLRAYTNHNLGALIVFVLFILFRFRESTHNGIRYVWDVVRFMTMWITLSCTVAFWFLFVYDIDALGGNAREFSVWAQHITHTLPFVFTLLLMQFHPRALALSALHYIFWIGVHISGYLLFVNWAYHYHAATSFYPYPFMNNLTPLTWCLLGGFGATVGSGVALVYTTTGKEKQT
jgi:hypothetical protein